jgi:hypothetical protein
VRTPLSSARVLDLDLLEAEDRADERASRLLLRDLDDLRDLLLRCLWRNFRCKRARRLLRLVKRMPVNMINAARSKSPPMTYLAFVPQDL